MRKMEDYLNEYLTKVNSNQNGDTAVNNKESKRVMGEQGILWVTANGMIVSADDELPATGMVVNLSDSPKILVSCRGVMFPHHFYMPDYSDESIAKALTDAETMLMHCVELARKNIGESSTEARELSYLELMNLYQRATQECESLKYDLAAERATVKSLEDQLDVALSWNEKFVKIFRFTQGYLSQGDAVRTLFWETKDGEISAEDGVISLIGAANEWAMDGHFPSEQALIRDIREYLELPF